MYSEAEAAAADLPMTKFVVTGLLPIGLTLFAAPPKIGKTWLNLGLCRAVATGDMFGGALPVQQGPVLFMDLEGNQRRTKKRSGLLRGDGVASDELHIVHKWPPMQSGGLQQLEAAIVANGYVLIVIDIWACFRPPRPKNADIYQHDLVSAQQVQELAHQTGTAIILTHHTRKSEANDWVSEASGSQGLSGGCDTLWALKRERSKADAVLHVTGRDIDEAELAMSFAHGKWTILGGAAEYRMGETRRVILECLARAGRPLSPKEIAEEAGLGRNVVKLALYRMLEDGQVTNAGVGGMPSRKTVSGDLGHFGVARCRAFRCHDTASA